MRCHLCALTAAGEGSAAALRTHAGANWNLSTVTSSSWPRLAGHILDELERVQKTPNVTRAYLRAVLRQRSGNRGCQHYLVLCRLPMIL
jgi:hypothetical protein